MNLEENNASEESKISREEFITQKKFYADENYLLREIAGESVLIPIGEDTVNTNRMFSLNSSCTYLWNAFQSPRTIADVAEEALEQYDVAKDELINDIIAFVLDYYRIELIREEK